MALTCHLIHTIRLGHCNTHDKHSVAQCNTCHLQCKMTKKVCLLVSCNLLCITDDKDISMVTCYSPTSIFVHFTITFTIHIMLHHTAIYKNVIYLFPTPIVIISYTMSYHYCEWKLRVASTPMPIRYDLLCKMQNLTCEGETRG